MMKFKALYTQWASIAVAAAVQVLTLGLVRLTIKCNLCEHDVEFNNVRNHMLWHLSRGEEWKR
jgi:hypothetical protein